MRAIVESLPLPGDAERIAVEVDADTWAHGGPPIARVVVTQRGRTDFKIELAWTDEFGALSHEQAWRVELEELAP